MRVFAYGRFFRFPSRTWERVLAGGGGRRVRRARDADHIVVGVGAASRSVEQLQSDLKEAKDKGQAVVSERNFLRQLGLVPPLPDGVRPFSAEEVAGRSRLEPGLLDLLILFDVIEGSEGRFGFRALKSASQARALLQKVSLSEIVLATAQLREMFGVAEPLSELQVTTDENGRIAVRTGEHLADLDGQLRLEMDASGADNAALLAEAEFARGAGDLGATEQLLRRVLARAPKEIDALFELGSMLCEQGHFGEGLALLQKATALRPDFADAWYNLGHAHERRGRRDEARNAYERAIRADPNYADPLYNLGMMEIDNGQFAKAIAALDAYLALDPQSEWGKRAHRAVALARLSLQNEAVSSGVG